MVSGASSHAPYYFVPHPSKWPIVGAIALAFFGFGLASWVNGAPFGPWLFAIFIAILAYMLVGWFSAVARESESGLYGDRIDVSFRWSMSWFIFSEVMFFAAFFGALYYARTIATPGSATWTTGRCCGPTSRRPGRMPAPRAWSNRSRRSGRGRSRR